METVLKFTRLITLLVVILIGFVIYLLATNLYSGTEEENMFWCGTVDPIRELTEDKSRYKYVSNYIKCEFDPQNGRALFIENCEGCHSTSSRITYGPGLFDIFERTPDCKWLFSFLKNQDSLIKEKDPYTMALRKAYNANVDYRHTQSNLSNQDLNDIVGFLGLLK